MLQSTHRMPGLVVRGHQFDLPLTPDNPARTIRVFAREVAAAGKEDAALPWLVYFQGGPGFAAARPMGASGWIGRAVQDYRVLLLDQRGTGLSSPVTAQTLQGLSPQAQAEYLSHFRADAIVRDAEAIRRALTGDAPWSVLGQSFGGFCALHYLSQAPQALREVFITGGIPPLARHTDDVYRATYPRVVAKNRLYYQRYPEDAARVRRIVDHLRAHEVTLPGGGRLSARRFLQLGLGLGMSDGWETLHYLLEEAWVCNAQGAEVLSWNFLHHVQQQQSFDTNPLYAVLHEACYTQGHASAWSAHRLLPEFPEFDLDGPGPVLFTGEMVYPWMCDDYAQLRPLKDCAELLAHKTDWPQLYDAQRLRANTVPVAAAVYYDDMYVHREFSEETARQIPKLQLWHTNEYEHNGLRADGAHVLGKLIDMVRGR